eukprot:2947455-Prymnesium_polylepis.1
MMTHPGERNPSHSLWTAVSSWRSIADHSRGSGAMAAAVGILKAQRWLSSRCRSCTFALTLCTLTRHKLTARPKKKNLPVYSGKSPVAGAHPKL